MIPAIMAYKSLPKVKVSSQVLAALLATAAGAGTFIGIRFMVKNLKQGLREKNALYEGNPAAYATQLKMAFENDTWFGWGTDEEVVFRTLEEIPGKFMFSKVQNAYRDLYGNNLATDLKDELSTEDYIQAMQILNSKS
jgi:hypothetical protein